jgi:hypothetical protein
MLMVSHRMEIPVAVNRVLVVGETETLAGRGKQDMAEEEISMDAELCQH